MALHEVVEVIDRDGDRYEVVSKHLSKFAAQQGILRPDNFVRAMRPGTTYTGKIVEGWQAATHARFIEKLDSETHQLKAFFFTAAAPKNGMDTFYEKVLKPSWPDLPPFKKFRQVLAGQKVLPGYRSTDPDLLLVRVRCPLIRLEGQEGLPGLPAANAGTLFLPATSLHIDSHDGPHSWLSLRRHSGRTAARCIARCPARCAA